MLEQLSKIGIVPVIKIEDAKKAVPLAKALMAGGLPAAEVTFRTAAAADAISEIAKNVPGMLVGAGTVLTVEQAKQAVDCGAKFLVSPGLNPKVVQWANDNGVLILPGVNTPSEIETALELGLKTVKFFPAEQSGGLPKIKAMCAPYGAITFMPTGGVSLDNLNDYLSFKKVVACGGSFMVKEDLIENENWDEITRLTRAAVDKMLGLSLAHVGINASDETEANKVTDDFAGLLNMAIKNGNSSNFVGGIIEIMKSPYLGKCGHIAVSTNYIERAVYHLGLRGFKFDEATKKYNAKGEFCAIYFEGEIGGFAVHLVQK